MASSPDLSGQTFPFSGNLEKLVRVYESRSEDVDRELGQAERERLDIQREISTIEDHVSGIWQQRRRAALDVQINKVVWTANDTKMRETKETVVRLADQVAEEACKVMELDFLVQHEEDLLACLAEETKVSETMVKLEVDTSPTGRDLKKAKLLLAEAKSRLAETESDIGALDQIHQDIQKIEAQKSLMTEKSNQLTKILMNSKSMYQSAINNLAHLDKEIKILSNKKDALKIRLQRRIEETKERLVGKSFEHDNM